MLQVYLNREAIVADGATPAEEWRGSAKQGRLVQTLTFNGVQLDVTNDGRITLYPGDLLAEIPATLQRFVAEVSCYDNFGNGLVPARRLGHYRLGTATAELMVVGSGQDEHYHVKIRAKNLADLRELYHLIRQGQIWPAIDYEAKQVPPPYRHFRDLISELWRLVRRDVRNRLFRIREQVRG